MYRGYNFVIAFFFTECENIYMYYFENLVEKKLSKGILLILNLL